MIYWYNALGKWNELIQHAGLAYTPAFWNRISVERCQEDSLGDITSQDVNEGPGEATQRTQHPGRMHHAKHVTQYNILWVKNKWR